MFESSNENISVLIKQLILPIEKENYKGWDVFDGLNSALFKRTPFFKSRIARLAWIQFFKKSPFNLRPFALVPKGYNAKGLSLFIQGYLNLYKAQNKTEYLQKAYRLAGLIADLRSQNRPYFCVGYNFHWEAKAFSVPPNTPNIIVSTFAAQAFLDLYEVDKSPLWLSYAEEIASFIEQELILVDDENELCFGYIPNKSARVHNANLMGARLMARLFSLTGDDKFFQYAEKSVNYSCNNQRNDGAWKYGERGHHNWVDNFHSGFNLTSVYYVQKYLNTNKWQKNVERGLAYHLKHHFLNDMTPKYFDYQLYPIDIHNFAQGIDTLYTFGYPEKAKQLLERCMILMWDTVNHFFYYQIMPHYVNKNNYIRWSQSWMFYSLTKHQLFLAH